VRLGVEAPPSVPVHRREVYEQIVAENLSAAGAPSQLDAIVERLRKAPMRLQPVTPAT
jgi:sRNA-binding carbon storage regulator CsrA